MKQALNTNKYAPPVSERSTPFVPLTVARTRCRFHPSRVNCRLTKILGLNSVSYEHFTFVAVRYVNTDARPYFEMLLGADSDGLRKNLLTVGAMICGVQFKEKPPETFYAITEAGERDSELIRMVCRQAYRFVYNQANRLVLLLKDLYVDCLYSQRQCVILPQELYCIYKDDVEPALNSIFSHETLPDTEEATASQDIYKSFVVYNTVLTMMLREANPFNDQRVISKIIESVGTCTGGHGTKRNYIKVCELNFGGDSPPNHVMCPPKEMVKRIYHYAKWVESPNNWRRYNELIVRDRKNNELALREWQAFVTNFKHHFFPGTPL
ncbi:vp1054 capsid protein [Helicoverpa armigera granulovirus]|uniref:Vp1054 capsid protein n=1 Tax=Helicoverpa armigera granulovirus TaxID=489830 RepID=A9YN15_9BBAC|nr:vp1054 capsid protein [Helicoverpa armigera granulovirus]ABY47864.1 vp1054 capsid protein [Helicoverpa armigera granulovirus]